MKKIFNDKDGKLKELENIVFEIERLKDTIDWAHSTIQSCLINLEGGKGLKESDVKMFAVDIRENLNKKEKAMAELDYYTNEKLKIELSKLKIINTPSGFLEDLDRLKKDRGINNFWVDLKKNI